MDLIQQALDFLHSLEPRVLFEQYGVWIYGILFLIIFAETGLVITPFLPGDTLLFATGALAATGEVQVLYLWLLLCIAAVLGDTVNYHIGKALGLRVFKDDARILKTAYLRKTEAFFEKYGGKTIILARFMPIVRTYAPFVAGASRMNYPKFLLYNVVGGLVWITSFLFAGYFFAEVPIVKNNMKIIIVAILILSILPGFVEFWRHRRAQSREAPVG